MVDSVAARLRILMPRQTRAVLTRKPTAPHATPATGPLNPAATSPTEMTRPTPPTEASSRPSEWRTLAPTDMVRGSRGQAGLNTPRSFFHHGAAGFASLT